MSKIPGFWREALVKPKDDLRTPGSVPPGSVPPGVGDRVSSAEWESRGDRSTIVGIVTNNVTYDHMKQQFTALIEREDDGYVSLCPELDMASQGDTVEDARNNLRVLGNNLSPIAH